MQTHGQSTFKFITLSINLSPLSKQGHLFSITYTIDKEFNDENHGFLTQTSFGKCNIFLVNFVSVARGLTMIVRCSRQ